MTIQHDLGRVFTPTIWAEWLLERSGAFEAWSAGATICDPTFGEGAFFYALLSLAEKKGISVSQGAIDRIFGVEIESQDKEAVLWGLKQRFGATLPPRNLITADVLSAQVSDQYDVLVGNPPWINFSKVDRRLRERWSQRYIELGLVKSKKEVLLGASRADLATAVLKKVVDLNLTDRGQAIFFVPLSMFFNSGANDLIRPHPASDHGYSIAQLWDFAEEPIFDGVATRYGAVHVVKGGRQAFPVQTNVRAGDKWIMAFSSPSDGRSGYWQRHDAQVPPAAARSISIRKEKKPRQGVNTCGAKDVLIFEDSGSSWVNGFGTPCDVEPELLFPLMNNSLFPSHRQRREPKQRMVLLPYDTETGRALTELQLRNFPRAWQYLTSHRDVLESRKGTIIQSSIKRGHWWSLLGVGPYSFAPWKVAWEALGRSEFRPAVVEGRWQGNQAMHAFCPCDARDEADSLVDLLSSPEIESALKASAMGGTLNWAQPGRVSKILELV